jgi:hypothetical protein
MNIINLLSVWAMAGDVKKSTGRKIKNVGQDYIKSVVHSRARVLPSYAVVARRVPALWPKVREGVSGVSRATVRQHRDGRLRCYRCGDVGHITVACRNALTYFKCVQLWHISSFCRSITSLPSSSSPPNLFFSSPHISLSSSTIPLSHYSFHSTISSHSRVLRFLELSTGVILETRGVTQADLLAALKVCFPCGWHQWGVQFMGNHRFLVHHY